MSFAFYSPNTGAGILQSMAQQYGYGEVSKNKNEFVQACLANNPHLPSIDRFCPSSTVVMPDVSFGHQDYFMSKADIKQAGQICETLTRAGSENRDFISSVNSNILGEKEENLFIKAIDSGRDAFIDRLADAMKDSRQKYIDIIRQYGSFKAGDISKGQYDYSRRVLILDAKRHLGEFERLLYPKRNVNEVIRIGRGVLARLDGIKSEINKLGAIRNVAKGAGMALVLIDVGEKIEKIRDAKYENRSIVLASSLGEIGGGAVGAVVGDAAAAVLVTVLVGTPVGWAAIATVAAGTIALTAMGSMIGGELGKNAMENFDRRVVGNETNSWINRNLDNIFKEFRL